MQVCHQAGSVLSVFQQTRERFEGRVLLIYKSNMLTQSTSIGWPFLGARLLAAGRGRSSARVASGVLLWAAGGGRCCAGVPAGALCGRADAWPLVGRCVDWPVVLVQVSVAGFAQ